VVECLPRKYKFKTQYCQNKKYNKQKEISASPVISEVWTGKYQFHYHICKGKNG
jgi:hypothetical protein